ncbi:MAG: hypothetical protein JW829_17375 [Pirellulales bacterium]|nr:hypothetical protein [Pirellulales bacterium]
MLDSTHPLAKLLRRDRRYPFEAYIFVFEALRYAHEKLGMGTKQPSVGTDHLSDEPGEDQHLTGQELCEAIRHYAMDQFGLMAQSVLNHWGIYSTSDFGEIVFNLIDIGQMRKTEHDCREDFECVYDFEEGLRRSYRIKPPRRSEEHR